MDNELQQSINDLKQRREDLEQQIDVLEKELAGKRDSHRRLTGAIKELNGQSPRRRKTTKKNGITTELTAELIEQVLKNQQGGMRLEQLKRAVSDQLADRDRTGLHLRLDAALQDAERFVEQDGVWGLVTG